MDQGICTCRSQHEIGSHQWIFFGSKCSVSSTCGIFNPKVPFNDHPGALLIEKAKKSKAPAMANLLKVTHVTLLKQCHVLFPALALQHKYLLYG